MDVSDARTLAVIALIAAVPIAIITLVALLRGYTIDLHMTRRRKPDDDEQA